MTKKPQQDIMNDDEDQVLHHPTSHLHVDTVALEQQVAELTEALQRERADTINIRRRHDEQIAGLKTVVKAGVVRDLLPVIDNFERALKHVPEELKHNDYIKGVQGVVKQFEKTLSDLGVQRIKTAGEPFDPKWHEAVAMEDGEGTQEVVSEELQAGYTIGDEVIRHAMVRVTMR
ncbi:MAG: nucleotide exchange factor GrpE [Candidatus Saccharibacteria bacterium]